jgi:hydrogenase maturation protease
MSANGVLVIGYGNELRGDDGLGPLIANEIERCRIAGVRTHVAHQLTPELAAEIAESLGVIFVDAQHGAAAGDVAVSQLECLEAGLLMTHSLRPETLLAMSRLLYERAPPAWLIAVSGNCFDIGSEITPAARARAEHAVEKIRQLIRILDARN